jgi:hypothetical protein
MARKQRGRLAELKGKHEIIGDVHGMALAALELVEDRKPRGASSGSRSGSRKSPAPWQGRSVRQCHPNFAAHEHRQY